jgi:hypothetical protein
LTLTLITSHEINYLKVPRLLLRQLKISKFISPSSFQDGYEDDSFVYCDEIIDAILVISALEDNKISFNIQEEKLYDKVLFVPWLCGYQCYDEDLLCNDYQSLKPIVKVNFNELI